MVFYKSYRYCDMATFISLGANILAFICLAAAFGLGGRLEGTMRVVVVGLLLALIPVLALFVGRKWTDQLAKKYSWINITTKVETGMIYVSDHPEEYEHICELNQAFAQTYVMNERRELVKRK